MQLLNLNIEHVKRKSILIYFVYVKSFLIKTFVHSSFLILGILADYFDHWV